jgi:hypothetical protein
VYANDTVDALNDALDSGTTNHSNDVSDDANQARRGGQRSKRNALAVTSTR